LIEAELSEDTKLFSAFIDNNTKININKFIDLGIDIKKIIGFHNILVFEKETARQAGNNTSFWGALIKEHFDFSNETFNKIRNQYNEFKPPPSESEFAAFSASEIAKKLEDGHPTLQQKKQMKKIKP